MKLIADIACKSLLLYLLIIPLGNAATPEYQIEAAFLFNFTQFVEWPAAAFQDPKSPLVIGVLGEDPFGSYLDDIVRGEAVNGHPLMIERYRSAQDIRRCHILFIADSERKNFNATLLGLKGQHVMTVSNLEGFARVGGIVRFRVVDSRLRFLVSIDAAREAQLIISSKLLKHADVIGRTED